MADPYFKTTDDGAEHIDKLNEFVEMVEGVQGGIDTVNEAVIEAQAAAANAAADAAGLAADAVRDEMQGYVGDARGARNESQQAALQAQLALGDATAIVYGGEFSTVPGPGRVPIARSDGTLDPLWMGEAAAAILQSGAVRVNDIGVPGTMGFGVGICPIVPEDYAVLAGTYAVSSPEYGNYTYSDGSVMVWIPAFYYRIGHPANPTYAQHGPNSVDVQPFAAFATTGEANASGYALHRAFIDGGEVVPGFMHDKYHCSNNGGVASSIKGAPPLSSHSTHNPFAGLTGSVSNTYAGAINAAKTRGAAFFPASVFMRGAIALLALAHAQAARSTVACAWYSAGNTNFPKGNNNDAFGDVNDPALSFTSDGFESNSALAGSGVPFAKTTHNGQDCGIADVNGNMYTINLGMTCLGSNRAVEAITQTNPVRIASTGHGLISGDQVRTNSITGPTTLNNRLFTVTVIDANTFSLDGVDGTGFPAWEGGGSVTGGRFYAAKQATRMEDFTGGASSATDHWGAAGVAAMMEEIAIPMRTDYSSNGVAQRFGNGANPVLDESVSGPGWLLTGIGFPMFDGSSTSGTSLFGQDYFYQDITNDLCVRSGGNWANGTLAGVWAVRLSSSHSGSNADTGFASASYPVRPSGS